MSDGEFDQTFLNFSDDLLEGEDARSTVVKEVWPSDARPTFDDGCHLAARRRSDDAPIWADDTDTGGENLGAR